ncbi:type II toxin-antitoxin system MqsA family antitoxin [Paraburkholderia sp. RL17-337-BIB-A]|uniref:type II toxin-antitoxin system MqsA family antitoxin n=1 Tax=Paraburkholderia sp. RL17-337-BIB-A TaxID=3031636 RepID=UPI0038BE0923
MKCPNCGADELVRDTRNLRYVYEGKTAIFEAVTGDYCPACEEAVLDMDEATRIGQMMAEVRGQLELELECGYVDLYGNSLGFLGEP